MDSKRRLQNMAVIAAGIVAAVGAVRADTDWFSSHPMHELKRERCYGIVRAGKNDCATAFHSCATQATISGNSQEWVLLPRGLCERIVGGKKEAS